MKKIEAIFKPFKLDEIKAVLEEYVLWRKIRGYLTRKGGGSLTKTEESFWRSFH